MSSVGLCRWCDRTCMGSYSTCCRSCGIAQGKCSSHDPDCDARARASLPAKSEPAAGATASGGSVLPATSQLLDAKLDYLGHYHSGDRIRVHADFFEIGSLSFNPLLTSELLQAIEEETPDPTGMLKQLMQRLGIWYLLEVQQEADTLTDQYETQCHHPGADTDYRDSARWLNGMVKLLRQAHFVPLSAGLMQFAEDNDYTWTLGTDIDWNSMDDDLIATFFDYLPPSRGPQPEFAKHALIFWRGVEEDHQSGYFWVQKVDVFFSIACQMIAPWLAFLSEVMPIRSALSLKTVVSNPPIARELSPPVLPTTASIHDEVKQIIPHQSLRSELLSRLPSQSLFFYVWTVLWRFLSRVAITGPAFSEVVLVYQRRNPASAQSTSTSAMCFQCFEGLPISDLEIVLPHTPRKSWADWLLTVLTVITLLSMARSFMSQPKVVLVGGLMYLGRRFVLHHLRQNQGQRRVAKYFSERERRTRAMPGKHKVRRSRDGLIHRLSQSARDQAFMQAALALAILSRDPDKTMTASAIDAACEHFLNRRFQCQIDFDIDCCLRDLCDLGLIAKCGEEQRFKCLDSSAANAKLCQKLASRLGITE